MKYISGEKIQFMCDIFLGTDKNFKVNPNINKYKNKLIYINSNYIFKNTDKLIFTYNSNKITLLSLINVLKNIKHPFKLIFHNSDKEFNKNHLVLFDKLPLLQKIYTQNMNVIHPNVIPLPIGFANSQWKHGNRNIYNKVYNMNLPKKYNIYFNFNINTNKKERQECFNCINKKNIKWNKNKLYKDYLIELKQHKFAICPVGNGLDTHRFWECLYMKTIPICKKNILVEYYQKYFPIVILEKWSDLNIEKLQYNFEIDCKYLDLDYIKNLLNKFD